MRRLALLQEGFPSKLRRRLVSWIKLVGVGAVIFLLMRSYVAQGIAVEGLSMSPTLLPGDVAVVRLLSRIAKADGSGPDRHDVIVVELGGEGGQRIAKRLVGMPNDTLMMQGGTLYVNSDPQSEPYATLDHRGSEATSGMLWQLPYLKDGVDPTTYFPTRNDWGPVVIPPDHYFVLGDNRGHSIDSRHRGLFPRSQVVGVMKFVYFSLDPDCCRPHEIFKAVRWTRIGTRVVGEAPGR